MEFAQTFVTVQAVYILFTPCMEPGCVYVYLPLVWSQAVYMYIYPLSGATLCIIYPLYGARLCIYLPLVWSQAVCIYLHFEWNQAVCIYLVHRQNV